MYVLRKTRDMWSWRSVRWAVAMAGGALWWWAVLRLAVQPARTGPVEGMIAAGGWGLGLIPLRATKHGGKFLGLPDGQIVDVHFSSPWFYQLLQVVTPPKVEQRVVVVPLGPP